MTWIHISHSMPLLAMIYDYQPYDCTGIVNDDDDDDDDIIIISYRYTPFKLLLFGGNDLPRSLAGLSLRPVQRRGGRDSTPCPSGAVRKSHGEVRKIPCLMKPQ